MGLGMRRYSAVWWISVFLKLMAVYTTVGGILGVGMWLIPNSSTHQFFGVDVVLSPTAYFLIHGTWHLLTNLGAAATFWAIGEILTHVMNTEAYARGTYAVFRKRAEHQQQLTSQAARIRSQTPIIPDSEIVPFEAPPPDPRKRKRLGESSGYRDTNTVFVRAAKVHERPENAVRPPRPAGEIEVIQDLNETPRGEDRGLPFDRV